MGTPLIHEHFIVESLNNCGFISTDKLTDGYPFQWAMNALMLGIGVGFDTKGAGHAMVFQPEKDIRFFVVEDTRESWAKSVAELVDSYLTDNSLDRKSTRLNSSHRL